MNHLSLASLAETVTQKRRKLKLSQTALAEKTGINRSVLSRLESGEYAPSVDQLLALSQVLEFDLQEVLEEDPDGLRPERLLQGAVGHLPDEAGVVLDAAEAAPHRAGHGGVLLDTVGAEDLEEDRLTEEPLLEDIRNPSPHVSGLRCF